MFRIIISILFIVLASSKLNAHQHWIEAQASYVDELNKQVQIEIGSGHNFPESTFALRDSVLYRSGIVESNDRLRLLKTAIKDKKRVGRCTFKVPGTYIVFFEVKKKQMKEPIFYGKTIVIAKNGDDLKRYKLGKGLEIVPEVMLSSLRKGDKLPLAVYENGERISARIAVLSDIGNRSFLSTNPKRAAVLGNVESGRYLFTVGHKGKYASLVVGVEK